MTDQQTCPHCGAEKICHVFSCLTVVDDLYDRGRACYERQLAQQAAEIEGLKTASATMAGMVLKAVLDEREACVAECRNWWKAEDCEKAIRARGEE